MAHRRNIRSRRAPAPRCRGRPPRFAAQLLERINRQLHAGSASQLLLGTGLTLQVVTGKPRDDIHGAHCIGGVFGWKNAGSGVAAASNSGCIGGRIGETATFGRNRLQALSPKVT
jgi:hypothetical protein